MSAPRWQALATKPRTASWATPRALYDALNREFAFTLDPCPLGAEGGLFAETDGLLTSWQGHRVYCNPPYGPQIAEWLAKWPEADLAVYLLPARTDTAWWHRHAGQASEVRFLRGRLKFGESRQSAPFPSVLLVYRQ